MSENAKRTTSELISDLDSVPSIVGNLGLSIAAAQKAFNLDYLETLERLLPLIKSVLGQDGADDAFLNEMLKRLIPPVYQYTETSLSVRLDLAQSERKAASGNLGVGTGAITLSAGMSASYGLDYRAAAEVRTVIHARPMDQNAMNSLLDRAKTLSQKEIDLPEGTPRIDQEINKTATRLAEQAGRSEDPPPSDPPPSSDPPADGAPQDSSSPADS